MVERNEATSSFGLPYDMLTLSTQGQYGSRFTVSPTLILALVEGSLGYKRVYSNANTWQYRKDTPFKTR